MKNIGIVGRKRSGKDTAAGFLVEQGYVRLGLADPLKDAALALDPIVYVGDGWELDPGSFTLIDRAYRLSEVVESVGWEAAKDRVPEVRRILQKLGDEAGRQVHGEETWIKNLLARVDAANRAGRPVVVPDVRYFNESAMLREAGFHLIRITRPGFDKPVPGEHKSERVERLPVHREIVNDGTIASLCDAILTVAESPVAA